MAISRFGLPTKTRTTRSNDFRRGKVRLPPKSKLNTPKKVR